MASLHPQNAPQGTFELNLVVMIVILHHNGENVFVHEEDIFVPVLGVPLEETLYSCPSDILQSRSREVCL